MGPFWGESTGGFPSQRVNHAEGIGLVTSNPNPVVVSVAPSRQTLLSSIDRNPIVVLTSKLRSPDLVAV